MGWSSNLEKKKKRNSSSDQGTPSNNLVRKVGWVV